MTDTTSLNDLPISPQTDSGANTTTSINYQENIQLKTNEKNHIVSDPMKELSQQREMDDKKVAGIQHQQNVINGALPPNTSNTLGSEKKNAPMPPSTANMNEFVSGIQAAAASGSLGLPSRDIPQQQTHLTQDAVTKPNYVPQGPDDYILKHQTSEEIMKQHMEKEKKVDKIDNLYNELQTPILVGTLYFVFQLPIVKKQMMKILPTIFLKDGNLNLSGYITYSILFSGMYYASIRTVNYLSE